ncbi:dihydrofolate reductase family protein [Actinomadura sp. 7K507]|uniref:dihydrofolate reductase family protein n=1 Tax=Actinomadura sp. 7K507 TaxID=2530365 RepID=UPI001A9E591F|nr:dihydrofolate reductase family protein [Actinomadura sp. 7K507]
MSTSERHPASDFAAGRSGAAMSKVVLCMSMSVDGFIAGPDDGPAHGLGVGGERLHDWLRPGGVDPLSHRPAGGPGATVFDELLGTGAVITGRRTFEFAGGWAGDHHDGVPIFVLTRTAPEEPPPGHARYVTEGVESCVAQAKAAASGRDILLHGAATAQECLRAGLLDELELQIVPVLLGQGRRLFEDMPPDHIELELLRALESPDVQFLRYRVRREA